jgi:hypothetical protein
MNSGDTLGAGMAPPEGRGHCNNQRKGDLTLVILIRMLTAVLAALAAALLLLAGLLLPAALLAALTRTRIVLLLLTWILRILRILLVRVGH